MSWDYFILGLYLVGALMGFGIACDFIYQAWRKLRRRRYISVIGLPQPDDRSWQRKFSEERRR